jgi:hypothetical protein
VFADAAKRSRRLTARPGDVVCASDARASCRLTSAARRSTGWTPVTPLSMLPRTFGVDRATLYRMQAEAAQYTDQATRLGAQSAIGAPSARSQMPESLSQFVKSFARTF